MCYNRIGINPLNLDNDIIALPSVQVPREVTTTSGCRVSLYFRDKDDPDIHREIARMLIAAFTKKRRDEHEASTVPVQSIDQRAG